MCLCTRVRVHVPVRVRVSVHVRVYVWLMSPVSNELIQTLPARLLQKSLGLSGTLNPPSVPVLKWAFP